MNGRNVCYLQSKGNAAAEQVAATTLPLLCKERPLQNVRLLMAQEQVLL